MHIDAKSWKNPKNAELRGVWCNVRNWQQRLANSHESSLPNWQLRLAISHESSLPGQCS